jgi:hypothetical protein
MKDQEKTREQLVSELGELRQRIAELEAFEDERRCGTMRNGIVHYRMHHLRQFLFPRKAFV